MKKSHLRSFAVAPRGIKLGCHTHEYKLGDFNIEKLNWDESSVWVINGPAGTGKTQYPLAHFTNPLIVTELEDLKMLSRSNDGVVFGDCTPQKPQICLRRPLFAANPSHQWADPPAGTFIPLCLGFHQVLSLLHQ